MKNDDVIDQIRRQWDRERPDLDSSGFALVGRLLRLGRQLERRAGRALESFDLPLWAFDVLATLRRQGPPYQLAPTDLGRATLLTPGAITNRIDRLEALGLVRREADLDDRRSIRVLLTQEGFDLVDKAIEVRFEEARNAVASLTSRERAALEKTLRRLLVALDSESDASKDTH